MTTVAGRYTSMASWADWFRHQLRSSASGLVWGFQLIPDRHRRELPPYPKYLGEWSPARHLWHITEYERCLALPSMRQWLGERQPEDDAWQDTDAAWIAASVQSDEALIDAYWQIREDQVRLIDNLADATWVQERDTAWGKEPLWKIVGKTYQHTYEHGDTLMRMGLWWDELLEQKARRAAEKAEGAIQSTPESSA